MVEAWSKWQLRYLIIIKVQFKIQSMKTPVKVQVLYYQNIGHSVVFLVHLSSKSTYIHTVIIIIFNYSSLTNLNGLMSKVKNDSLFTGQSFKPQKSYFKLLIQIEWCGILIVKRLKFMETKSKFNRAMKTWMTIIYYIDTKININTVKGGHAP